MKNFATVILTAWVALALPQELESQVETCQFRGTTDALLQRPSPLDSVVVRLGGAEAKLCYGRPTTDGRVMIGGEVPFGSPWEMGANEPTTLHLPFPAQVGGVELGPGSYSLYAIPSEDTWTIVVNGNPDRWGVPISAAVRAADLGSFAVRPAPTTERVESLTFGYQPAGPSAGTLVLSWERTALSIPLARR